MLYTTVQPCFGCLKEAIQAGISRIVYAEPYPPHGDAEVVKQYKALVAHVGEFEQRSVQELSVDTTAA